MKLKKNLKVTFFEEEHVYLNEKDEILEGITSLLGRTVFEGKYDKIPEQILRNAAERGKFIHEQIESFDNGDEFILCDELANYQILKERYGIVPIANEYLVSDNMMYATKVDMIDKDLNLYDFKTTYELDHLYLAYQLSCSAILFEAQTGVRVNKLYAIWLRGDKHERVAVERLPDEVINDLMYNGIYTHSSHAATEIKLSTEKLNDLNIMLNLEESIVAFEKRLSELNAQKKTLMAGILEEMDKADIDKFESAQMILKRVKPTTRTTINSQMLRDTYPEIYDKVKSESTVKGYLKLTLKK